MRPHPFQEAEASRRVAQETFDAHTPASVRNRVGQFATPYPLAVEIARFVRSVAGGDPAAIRFADPAVGMGSLYSAVLAVFGREAIQSAVGVERDEAVATTARDIWGRTGLTVIPGDFTKLVAERGRLPRPNLLIANPPYVRHHHLPAMEKDRLQSLAERMAGLPVNGLAGLYVYFLLAATCWMEPGGYAAWLVPSEFMDVNYGSTVRRFLTDRVTLLRVHRFDPEDVQFGDALVSSAVLVFRVAIPPPGQAAEFSHGGTLFAPHALEAVPLGQLRSARKWTTYPKHAGNDRRGSSGGGATLGDLFRIQRGVATGCDNFFILDRVTARELGLPESYLRPILPSPRRLKTTVIAVGDDGYPALDTQLCLLDCDLSEPVIEQRHPALWTYLRTAGPLGVTDRYLVRKRRPWYRQEQRTPPPFLCSYMGRGAGHRRPFRFIWNRSRAIGTNLYLMLYPRPRLAHLLRDRPEREEAVFDFLQGITGDELRGAGRVYGGGLNKIEPRELGHVSAEVLVRRWPELVAEASHQPGLFD